VCVCVCVCVCALLSEMVGEMRSLHFTKERYGESEKLAEWGQSQPYKKNSLICCIQTAWEDRKVVVFWKGNDMNLGRMVRYWQKFVLFLLTIYWTMLQCLGTQLGTRITRKSGIQCASGRWNILGNIIYVKCVVGRSIKLCYVGSSCKEITQSTSLCLTPF
jgi:hypothetical protein